MKKRIGENRKEGRNREAEKKRKEEGNWGEKKIERKISRNREG